MAKSQFVEAGGLRIHYLEAGKGSPLILLHGGLATAESLSGPIADLAKTYRVLAPDSRGHGRTSNPGGTLGYAQMADDVAAFIDALKLERPAIVGYSDGGQIALEFGLRHPGKARALGFGGTITGMGDEYLETLHGWGFRRAGEVDFAQLEKSFGDFFTSIKQVHGPADEPDYWRGLLEAISTLWLSVPTYGPEVLATITDPALVITGDRDGAAMAQAVPFFRAMPKGELAVILKAEHEAVLRPLFWDSVKDFLGRHPA